jgi:hypothetical protein
MQLNRVYELLRANPFDQSSNALSEPTAINKHSLAGG